MIVRQAHSRLGAAIGAAGFLTITVAAFTSPVQRLDLAVRDLADAHRPAAAQAVAQVVNGLGSGLALTAAALVIAAILGWRGRSWRPPVLVLAALAALIVTVWPVKLLLHRAAPHSPAPSEVEVRLLSQPGGLSFPSGHAVNAVVWYAVICLLLAAWLPLAARRWLRWAPPVLVTAAGTYLGYHWLTDMLAGLCLGLLIVDLGLIRVVGDQSTRISPRSTALSKRR